MQKNISPLKFSFKHNFWYLNLFRTLIKHNFLQHINAFCFCLICDWNWILKNQQTKADKIEGIVYIAPSKIKFEK